MATKHFEFGYITSGDTPDDCSFDDVGTHRCDCCRIYIARKCQSSPK